MIINYHGPPRVIITIRGTNFTSELFNHLCKALKTKQCTTAAHHPQSNGLTERLNKNKVDMLWKCLMNGYDDWEEMLGHVAFAYRHSLNSFTHEMPYFLNHGWDAVKPIGSLREISIAFRYTWSESVFHADSHGIFYFFFKSAEMCVFLI
jgi:transposase InsO family protein